VAFGDEPAARPAAIDAPARLGIATTMIRRQQAPRVMLPGCSG
jgi:hypothetical protein